jgi:uncharacterized protein (TIGR02266 family)
MTAAMGPKVKGDAVAAVPLPLSDAERRQAPRVLVDLEVDYASEENYLFAYITDISATGIFVRTTTPEAPGTHLNLRFSSEHSGHLEVEGEVIWVNPYRPGRPDNLHPGMGIRFVSIDNDLRDCLFELIRRFAYLS